MPMKRRRRVKKTGNQQRLRWAVAGQGHFAQTAILPAFEHAADTSELVALFSDDETKRNQLRRQYGASFALPYAELDDFLRSGEVNALYVAVPNHRHREFTIRAAAAGVNVLCEKPMAPTSAECREMIDACARARVKLMIAYRLHLEPANLTAVERIQQGAIGDPRYFISAFSFPLDPGNVRTKATAEGGGPLYDIGVYCINAARYLLRAEPEEVVAMTGRRPDDPRFNVTQEQVSAIMRFPGDRLATFTCGFAGADVSELTVVGTRGSLRLDPAFSHTKPLAMEERRQRGKPKRRQFPQTDQVAAELAYFAECVIEDREPEPSGWEGFHDVRIIEAILKAARTGRRVELRLEPRRQRPGLPQARRRPPVRRTPPTVNVDAPRAGS